MRDIVVMGNYVDDIERGAAAPVPGEITYPTMREKQ